MKQALTYPKLCQGQDYAHSRFSKSKPEVRCQTVSGRAGPEPTLPTGVWEAPEGNSGYICSITHVPIPASEEGREAAPSLPEPPRAGASHPVPPHIPWTGTELLRPRAFASPRPARSRLHPHLSVMPSRPPPPGSLELHHTRWAVTSEGPSELRGAMP